MVIVYFKRRKDVDVLKGENKGQRMTYWNSVSDIQSVGMWNGNDLKLTVPSKVLRNNGCDGFAVLLQSSTQNGEPGRIIGADMVMTPPAINETALKNVDKNVDP